jgi:hypothetical protein
VFALIIVTLMTSGVITRTHNAGAMREPRCKSFFKIKKSDGNPEAPGICGLRRRISPRNVGLSGTAGNQDASWGPLNLMQFLISEGPIFKDVYRGFTINHRSTSGSIGAAHIPLASGFGTAFSLFLLDGGFKTHCMGVYHHERSNDRVVLRT